jgi:hypothetical protein
MRGLLFVGLAVSAALIVPQQARSEAQWCRINRDAGGKECIFYTFDQCAMSTERLNGGNCVENPSFHGSSTPVAGRPVRAKGHVSRHTLHHTEGAR